MARSPVFRIVFTFVALDVLFTGLLSYAYFVMMGVDDVGVGTSVAVLVGLWLIKVVGWVATTLARLRPLTRWTTAARAGNDSRAILAAATAAYQAPFGISLSWSGLFGVISLAHTLILYFGFSDAVPLGPRSLDVVLFVSLASFIGAEALAFPLAEWLLAPVISRISLAAHERGITIPGRGLSLRARLVTFSLAIALAPSMYLGGITYMNDARASQGDLVRQAALAAAEVALGHAEAARAVDGAVFTFDASGPIVGEDAARAFAARPLLEHLFAAAASAQPAGTVSHPRYGAVAFRTDRDRRLGVIIAKPPSVSLGTLVLLLVFLGIVVTWGPMSAMFIANATAAPVARLSDALARVGDGEVANAPKVPVFHQDEVGALATNYNRMLDQLRELARRAGEIAKGDLGIDLSVQGDLGDAFRDQLTSLRDMVGHIAQNATQLAGAASEMYAAAQEQEAAAQQQSAGIEEVSRTMDSLLVAATHVTDSTMGVLDRAERTLETTSRTSARISEMSGHASRIGEILEIIREIADRSDLLALNASLEGNHAGEAGRGFALVAGEMRKLAERVTESVHDIKKLVSDVRASVSATVLATEESSRLAEGTTESARQINLVTQQQRSGTEQAGQNMRDVAAMITQSLAATQQIRTLAEDLKLQADNLTRLVARFRLPERRREAA